MTSLTSGMRRATGATHSGARTSIGAAGRCSRSRASSGCAISASPIQFGATTRMRGTNALLLVRPYRCKASRSRGSATCPRARRRGTPADAAPTAVRPASGNAAAGSSRLLRLLYWCQPFAPLLVLAGHDVEESLLDRLGHRARLARADHAPVELADRRHLRRGAGEERLVGDVDVVARERARDHLVAELAGEVDHRGERDAGEGRGEHRLEELAVLDDEDVLARALGDVAIDIQQQAFVVAVLGRLRRR